MIRGSAAASRVIILGDEMEKKSECRAPQCDVPGSTVPELGHVICGRLPLIEVHHFFPEVPRIRELKTSPENRLGGNFSCYRMKNPMAKVHRSLINTGSSKSKFKTTPPANMPLAISCPRAIIWYNCHPHDHLNRVTRPCTCCIRPWAVSTNETRIEQYSVFLQASGGDRKKRRIFHEMIGGSPRNAEFFFLQKRTSDLPVFNLKQSLAKKICPTLKPSHQKKSNASYSFLSTKVQCRRCFIQIEHENLHTRVLYVPIPMSDISVYFLFVFV